MEVAQAKQEFCKLGPDPNGSNGAVVCPICNFKSTKMVYKVCPGKPGVSKTEFLAGRREQRKQERQSQTNGGPGTELKRLLRKIGIVPTPNCKCNKRAVIMDIEGPDWCQEHLEDIVDWLEEEAANQGKLFVRTAGRLLVKLAIYRARKRARLYP